MKAWMNALHALAPSCVHAFTFSRLHTFYHRAFTPSRLHTITPSHLRTFIPSRLHTMTPSRLHTFPAPLPPFPPLAESVYNAAMQKVAFGKTGLSVSRLGFGGAPIGYLKVDQERAARILNLLLDNGVNLIDTAASYPGSEELIGSTVGHRRDQFVLVSKCGGALADVEGSAWSAKLIEATVDRSLRKLNTDRLDVMLLHSCDLATLRKGEALGALVKARDAGKIRFVGYSGDNEAAVYAVSQRDVAVLETSVNITDQANLRTVIPTAQQNGIGVLAKRPIANAAWKEITEQPGLYQSYARTYYDRLRAMKLNPTDLGFAGPMDAVWPELAMRFTLSFPGVHCAITGTTNPDNARANISYADRGPLPEDVVRKIEQVYRAADPQGKWEGQT